MFIDLDPEVTKKADEGGNFELLPEGDYEGTIYEASVEEFGPKSKNAGRPKLDLVLKISSGKYKNYQVWEYNLPLTQAWVSGKPSILTHQFIRALGLQVEEGATGVEIPDIDDLLGTPIKFRVKHEVRYSDRDKADEEQRLNAKVDRFLAPTTDISGILKEPVEADAPAVKSKGKIEL